MIWLLCLVYGMLALVAASNLLLLRRAKDRRTPEEGPEIAVLIPARDEETNLLRLIPQLLAPNPGLKVYVYDDDSADGTAKVAAAAGAIVLKGGPLPSGWTGKNNACHRLGQAAAEDSDAAWILFLDADVTPAPDFIPALRATAATVRPGVGVFTAFPTLTPGEGPEPLFLAWVGWVLLSTNPFGLSARTGLGHSQFTNGQMTLWRSEVYTRLWPNERLKHAVLEDVRIGRMLKDEHVGLEVASMAGQFSVRMYENWHQALDGMSKNAYEITGTTTGSVAVALLFLLLGWAWLAAGTMWWAPLGLLTLSGVFAALTVRASWLGAIFMPVVLSIGAFAVLRSMVWHRRGAVKWKGRTYGGA
jgi:hypothetical protein